MEKELPGPREAQTVVKEALELEPDPHQQARLWEFLADAWCTGPGGRLPLEAAEGGSPYEQALEALGRGLAALGEPGPGTQEEEQTARLLRKRASLEIRLRRLKEAHQSIRAAAACLADHPFHVEQPRLRLALGRFHLVQGSTGKAVRALEEGLALLNQKGAAADRRDQVELLVELGRIQGQQAQFQRALSSLGAGKRFLEHEGDRRRLVGVLNALGQVHEGLGQMDAAYQYLNEALGLARTLDDPELKAACHLDLGILRSGQQRVGPALAHIDNALRRYQELGDRPRAARAMVWKARTLGALGDMVQAEFLLLKASELPSGMASPMEAGDMTFLGGEIATFRQAFRDARRLFREAANRYSEAGFHWREQLARLRYIQAEALEPGGQAPEAAWIHLERLKGTIDGTGSRWLELEWRLAHALLLSRSGSEESVVSEALLAWGDVVALARELKFPAVVLDAETRASRLLLARGEKLGARGRIQDALPSFQELWTRLPETLESHFLGRPDIHAFQEAVEATGLRFVLPTKEDPLADWSPTQANLPLIPTARVNP
jgi:tetratricopeptide (TPR) repeat protein